MYSYREQRDLLDAVKLREGQSRRVDCPFCGGRKTLSLSRRDGRRMWNCFKASCGSRGVTGAEMDAQTIRRRLEKAADSQKTRRAPDIPEHLSRPEHHEDVVRYLTAVHSLWAYENGLINIRYAPAENRVLFFFSGDRGAAGRALDSRKPKWRAYGDTRGLLCVGSGDTAVLVEDAASACSVARFTNCSGCALLGTSISSEQKEQLRYYKRVLIALDKDASRKAVFLKQKLEGKIPTSVLLLEDDLKYADEDTLKRTLT